MADGETGALWLCVAGLGLWLYNTSDNLAGEILDRGDASFKAQQSDADLERRINALESKLNMTEAEVKDVANAHESLRQTFNGNVDIENRAKVKRMTAAGACGTEVVNFKDGGWTVRNKECTLKDLK